MIFLPLSIKSEPAGKNPLFSRHREDKFVFNSKYFNHHHPPPPALFPDGNDWTGNAIIWQSPADDNYFLNYSDWGMVPEQGFRSFFDNSDAIVTSLLVLKIIYVLANFLILSDALLFKYFSLWGEKFMELVSCVSCYNDVKIRRFILTIKLCLDGGNDDYITLCVILVILSRTVLKLEPRVAASKRKVGLKWVTV